jgi:hypothetical protein
MMGPIDPSARTAGTTEADGRVIEDTLVLADEREGGM